MPGGEIFAYAFFAGGILRLLGLALFVCGLAWAFSERPRAQLAYWLASGLILSVHALILLFSGPVQWFWAWFSWSSGELMFLLLTIWLVLGVPAVRWARRRLVPPARRRGAK